MTERTGSYPLKDLASGHGVDYGDVLQVADWFAHLYRGLGDDYPPARVDQADDAMDRIEATTSAHGAASLRSELRLHAIRRWGMTRG